MVALPGIQTHMEFHEVANLFPLIEGKEFDDLVEDIRVNGLQQPIWTYQGKIIDGRNRYRACIEAGVEPQFREWRGNGSLIAFVVSLNLKRRHLTSSQKAMVAIEIERMLGEEARKLQGARTDLFQNFEKGEPIHAAKQAAAIVGTNHQYVVDAKKIVELAPELKEVVLNGTMKIPEAKVVAAMPKDQRDIHVMRVMGSSESPEWYTPQSVIDCVLACFSEIDLDPCSNSHEHPSVPAHTLYTRDDNGLAQDWHGKVYLNPPYGSEIPEWIRKLVYEYEVTGNVTEAIALLPGRIDTNWFQPLYEYVMCNVHGRLQFANSPYNSPFPAVIVYLGCRIENFIDTFKGLGPIMRRIG